MNAHNIFTLLLICFYPRISYGFMQGRTGVKTVSYKGHAPIVSIAQQFFRLNVAGTDDSTELTEVDDVIADLHNSGFPFRIVVIGNGAILETTSKLGPVMKSSVSPKTGDRLVTLASEDQSFEFHVKVDQVSKVVFAETIKPLEGGEEKVLRICRFMSGDGGSICSLILGESGEDATEWFDGMKARYGGN